MNYPHTLDWFFRERTEQFFKYWLYNTLGTEWHWCRYKFAFLCNGIHTHGLAKLKTVSGLCALPDKVMEGHKAHLTLS